MTMENTKYGELVPDKIVDTFYKRIEQCINEKNSTYTIENWVKSLIRVNGKIPDKIKNLIRVNEINQLLDSD